ncbi:hypothetical protein [Pseudonocardia broussonetiae]|uniref:Uncharacterized protein n=1 Tax=Pseudonocardia broussonetiae TaxID=2736640 RepID=A0A6M6JMG5_9PSEU|nr:hypothetical protein [Pseudonocardia broussonetiae]QJY48403.1 hypothetical protein HOP40_23590 [Pseudonocardia broussonetiae]
MSEQQLQDLGERLGDYVRSLLSEDGPAANGVAAVLLDDHREAESFESLDPDADELLISREVAAQTGMRSKKFNHRGKEWWDPFTSRDGVDRFEFKIPPGRVFSHYELRPITTTFPHELEVKKAPGAGATGAQHIDVHWKLWGGGQVAYEVRGVYHREQDEPPPLRVVVGSEGWDRLGFQLVEQRRNFSLVVVGPDAKRIWNDIRRFAGGSPNEVAGIDDAFVALTAVVLAGVIGTILVAGGLLVLNNILGAAVKAGCNAKATFTKGEALAAGELSFDINCFGRS